jgi:hypothetical protein
MRLVLAALTLLLAGCASNPNAPSAINQPAGKDRDFADYMLAHDETIMQDAAAMGASRDQAHCAAEEFGWKVYQSEYRTLSDAVSGKRQITRQEEQWAQNRLSAVLHNKEKGRQIIEDAWKKCVG